MTDLFKLFLGVLASLFWSSNAGGEKSGPIVMLVPAYRAIEAAARRREFDPDNPSHLSKVTRTT